MQLLPESPWEVAPWWIRGERPASLFRVDLPDPGDEPPPGAIRLQAAFQVAGLKILDVSSVSRCQVKTLGLGFRKKWNVLSL